MDMRFGTWNVRSLYRAGSLMTVAKEISKYKLDLMGVQEVRWDKGGTEPAGEYTFSSGKGNENHELGTVFFLQIILAVKKVESVSDRMSHITLRGRCSECSSYLKDIAENCIMRRFITCTLHQV
jgi:exonuclease III